MSIKRMKTRRTKESRCLSDDMLIDSKDLKMENLGPAMIFLPCDPSREEWNNILAAAKTGIALTGSAAMRPMGSIIGLVDIYESIDHYWFCTSLPGVKRDEREFSCEMEINGRVLIKGVSTMGEQSVIRRSHVFKMQTQNLPPPGFFSIAFNLPGPIEPHKFSGKFGIDGIFEGRIMKWRADL